MAEFTYDHMHLRSPDPEATAAFYEHMFGAQILRSVQGGTPRIDLKPAGGIIGLGFDEFRWPQPVRPGDELHLTSEILEVRPSKSRQSGASP